MSKQKYIKWDECIHIHACRRFAKIVERITGKKVSRGCGKNCEAFESKELIDKACEWLEENAQEYVEANTIYPETIEGYSYYKPDCWIRDSLVYDFRESMEEL